MKGSKGSKFVCGDLAWFLKEMMVLEEREGGDKRKRCKESSCERRSHMSFVF